MLGTKHLRARVQGQRIEPLFIKPDRPDLVALTEQLCGLAREAVAGRWSRGELTEAVEAITATARSTKVAQGLAHLVVGGATWDVDSPIPPAEVRALAFARAYATGPLALPGDSLGRRTADDVLAEVAAELGVDADAVRRALYADLADAAVLIALDVPSPSEVLERYNTSLVQAMLLRAVEVRVRLHKPSVNRVRQLLRHARFRQLIFRCERDDDELVLTFDGPSSLFRQTTRYGSQLALFFPAVLLQTCPWSLEATVLWGPARHPLSLSLTHEAGLQAGIADTGAWVTPEQEAFAERWAAAGETGWTMSTDTEPIVLTDRTVVLPDATFTRDGRTAHLDIVGYWRRAWLTRHLDALREHGPGNLVVAISRGLQAGEQDLPDLPGAVVVFAKVLPVRKVLDAVEEVAR